MKKIGTDQSHQSVINEPQFEDILLSMLSYEATIKMRIEELSIQIELALEQKNKTLFMNATSELNTLREILNK